MAVRPPDPGLHQSFFRVMVYHTRSMGAQQRIPTGDSMAVRPPDRHAGWLTKRRGNGIITLYIV